jgi:hypothetical protein
MTMTTMQSYLDPEASAQLVARIRSLNPEWFALADASLLVALHVLALTEPSTSDNVQVVAAPLMARVVTSFQSTYLLAERGLCSDARSIVRGQIESALTLGALVVRPQDTLDLLMRRDVVHRKKLLGSWLNDPEAVAVLTTERQREFSQAIATLEQEFPGLKNDPLNLAELARWQNAMWLYNGGYRIFSGDSAHTSLLSLQNHHIRANADGEILSLKYGPDPALVSNTLFSAISSLNWAAKSATLIFNLRQFYAVLDDLKNKWQALGASVPTV